jgi:hypothetical protein
MFTEKEIILLQAALVDRMDYLARSPGYLGEWGRRK